MERFKTIAIALLIALLIASVCYQGSIGEQNNYSDTIVTTYIDTVTYIQPVPRDSVVVRYATVRVPVVVADTVSITVTDSVVVELPISQKVYRDSSYTAWVSGYQPSLDSISLRLHREVITIKEYTKPKRWSLGVQAGYGLTYKGLSPYIGVGITYSIVSF